MKSASRALFLAALMLPGALWAHHSYAMFDTTKNVVLTGTVKNWRWTNPHCWLSLIAQDQQGHVVEWGLEGGSPEVFRSRGWPRTVMKPGDKVTVTVHPLRSGAIGGSLESVTAVDGNTYTISAAADRAASTK